MHFKKFVASLAVSTMLVGSQAAVYADEESPKTEVSQRANSEERGVVKTVLDCTPGILGTANSLVNFFFYNKGKEPKIWFLKLPSFTVYYGNDECAISTHIVDGLFVAYSVVQFIGLI